MNRKYATGKILDEALRITVSAGALAGALVLPNLLIALEKPLNKYLDNYDQRERQREAKRIIYYMKSQGYLRGEYEHGLQITAKGRKHLQKMDFEQLQIGNQSLWDHMWRIVFYDIPESNKAGRQSLTSKLRKMGFFQLQRSVWIHPLPCRDVIEKVTNMYELDKFVSYIETAHLDNQNILLKRFQKQLPQTKF